LGEQILVAARGRNPATFWKKGSVPGYLQAMSSDGRYMERELSVVFPEFVKGTLRSRARRQGIHGV